MLAQAATVNDSVEVFSKYAVVAGVTSQADSPLPGPGDVAAVGILVLGLIDAGLLAGAILHAIEDATSTTTSSAPIATTMPMATTAPTVDAPPVPITQTETDKEKERCDKVKAECLEDCNYLMGQGYRPPRPGKTGRGRPGGGTNTQFDHKKCYNECKAKHGC